MLLMAALVAASPIFIINEKLYPLRVDSAYVYALQSKYDKDLKEGRAIPGKTFYYSPSQLGMEYEDIAIESQDSIILKGWYFNKPHEPNGITLLILHDVGEGKLNYLDKAKSFIDLGFRVCVMDLRASGESEGSFFTLGNRGVRDITDILDFLYCYAETDHIAIIATGTGAALAIENNSIDNRIFSLVIQNPFLNFKDYLFSFGEEKWGPLNLLFYKLMERETENKMQISLDSLNLERLISRITIPTLFITAEKNKSNQAFLISLYRASGAINKKFKKADEKPVQYTEENDLKDYYNTVASFVISNIPVKQKKTRFKKLADS